MNKVELCKKLSKITVPVLVYSGNELISKGSGFLSNDRGTVITAAHVITTRLPVRKSDVFDPELKILVKFGKKDIAEYKIKTCGITFTIKPIGNVTIDIAVIIPKKARKSEFAYSSNKDLNIGEDVLLAGFPDEVGLPFEIDHLIMKGFVPVDNYNSIMDSIKTFLMIKSGMIASLGRYEMVDITSEKICKGNIIYIDNSMHSGSSGGPIMNMNGEIIGIITQRAITSYSTEELPNYNIPSGTSIGLSLRPIVEFL